MPLLTSPASRGEAARAMAYQLPTTEGGGISSDGESCACSMGGPGQTEASGEWNQTHTPNSLWSFTFYCA